MISDRIQPLALLRRESMTDLFLALKPAVESQVHKRLERNQLILLLEFEAHERD